jgi:glycosyltransferase EpsE
MRPLVTAFITVYNEEEWIGRAVRSLLDQTLRDIEVLVVDDGSTDGTPAILAAVDDPRFRVLRLPRSGRAAALATATVQARGKYLANLDADDEALPLRLAEQAGYLERHAECGWLGAGERRVDTQRGERFDRCYPRSDAAIRRQAARCIPYCHSAVMFRGDLVRRGINYDPRQPYLIDFEFFLRVLRHCEAANLPEVLVTRRVRNESYFQQSFSTLHQDWRLACLSARAVRQFHLPVWHYACPAMRFAYRCLPAWAKRRVRAHSGLLEIQRGRV